MTLNQSEQIVKYGQDKSRLCRGHSGHSNDQLEDAVVEDKLQRNVKSKQTVKEQMKR